VDDVNEALLAIAADIKSNQFAPVIILTEDMHYYSGLPEKAAWAALKPILIDTMNIAVIE